MTSLERVILPALNHLLAGESWASARLRPFAGCRTRIEAGWVALRLVVDERGYFALAEGEGEPDVTIALPADTALLFVVDRKRIFQSARIAGSADFAEALAFVFRNLRWDVEADLARIVGDIPARRLEQLRKGSVARIEEGGKRLVQNLAEYATEESSLLVPRREIEDFAGEVSRLRDDCARLEKRLARL